MSEPVRWGVLGAAGFARGRWLPSFVQTPGVSGVGIASRNLEKAEDTARQFGFPKTYGDYDALLADPDIEAVYIPLPNGLHGTWSIRALEAGKHVYVEKPAANDAAEARRMAAAARAAGKRLLEGFMPRHHARWKRVKELVEQGAVGQPLLVEGAFTFMLGNADDVRWDPNLAGGALADVGCYPVNGARFVFGVEPTHAWGAARDTRGAGVDTTFAGGLRFPEGEMLFRCSFETVGSQAFSITGSEGALSLDPPWAAGESATITVRDKAGAAREERVDGRDQYVDIISHFCACIRDPEKPLWPGEDGVASACALDALRRSAATGRLEPVEPA